MKLAVVFNPTKVTREELAPVVDSANEAAGYDEPVWIETTADDPGTGMARQAQEEGADVVLAVGGDGTIRAVAEGLRGSKAALALCPQGTGNLLARNLGLTLDNLSESVDAAYNGVPRPVDLGMAELRFVGGRTAERGFVVMAGMGLDATIMSTTDEELKKKVGMLAYVKAGLEALRHSGRMRLSYRLDDDDPGRSKVHTVLLGNCGSIGNNVFLMPDAAVDDGLLDVVAVQPQGWFGWLRLARKILIDNFILRRTKRSDRGSRELSYQQCRRVELRMRKPQQIQLDGDPCGEIVALRAWVEPGALRVMMPAGWEPSGH